MSLFIKIFSSTNGMKNKTKYITSFTAVEYRAMLILNLCDFNDDQHPKNKSTKRAINTQWNN